MANITVFGKGNLGHSLKFGEIIAGESYTIDEKDFAAELFTKEAPPVSISAVPEETSKAIQGGKKK